MRLGMRGNWRQLSNRGFRVASPLSAMSKKKKLRGEDSCIIDSAVSGESQYYQTIIEIKLDDSSGLCPSIAEPLS